MADKRAVSGPVQAAVRAEGAKYREREELARTERHRRAALQAGSLFQAAAAGRPAEQPVWVRAVILLMQAIRADYATVATVHGEQGLRCRITRGWGLEGPPTWPGPGTPPPESASGALSTRVEVDLLSPAPARVTAPGNPVPGASSSFHALLYPAGSPQPLGCLSLYSRTDLSLVADRVAFIHAVAAVLARELAGAASTEPLSG
jgi:hypothetical protein